MKIFLLISLGLVLLLAYPSSVSADDFRFDQDKVFLQTSGQNLVSETALIKNLTDQPQEIVISWKEFEQSAHRIDFAQINPTKLSLQPFAVGTVSINFSTPANLKSGDYYGTLVATSANNKAETDFTLRFLGQLTEKISRDDFAYNNDRLTLQLSNQGNVTTKVSGQMVVTNFFGQKVFETKLPLTDLKATETLNLSFEMETNLPGPYQAKLKLITGEKNVNQTSLYSFWISPTFFVTLTVVTALVLIFAVILIWRKTHV